MKNKKAPSKSNPLIYGMHATKAALLNPQRNCQRLWVTKEIKDSLQVEGVLQLHSKLDIQVVDKMQLITIVGEGAVHQGIVLQAEPLTTVHLEDLLAGCPTNALVVVLDQVTDPHNVGAILRSCAAFGAIAVIQPARNAPDIANSIVAKTASGAIEKVSMINVTNLVSALKTLQQHQFWCIGLDEHGKQSLSQVDFSGRIAIVMGGEFRGMRRLTKDSCDLLVRLPTIPEFPTLNVSTAAAITLYEFARRK